VFLKFLASIDDLERGSHEKMLVSSVDRSESARDRMLETDAAEAILDYLDTHEHAPRRQAPLTVLWHTGCRTGAAHSLDTDGFDADGRSLTLRHRPDTGTRLENEIGRARLCHVGRCL
jgi:integrase